MRKQIFLAILTLWAMTSTAQTPIHSYKIKATYPHNTKSYTQGLIWQDSVLIEGTGLYGKSKLMRVDLETGKSNHEISLENQYFGEGITQLGNKIYQITWQENTMFIYDAKTFKKIGEHKYKGEGWGLTTDGTYIYMSSGNDIIQIIDPESLEVIHNIKVSDKGMNISYLNELEWIEGEIWANVYQTDVIVKINPSNGVVTGIIDLIGLLPTSERTKDTDVLNGIAYDSKNKKIYLTGKNWSKLYEIELK